MQKSEQRMKAICEYIEEYQFEYHRTPTMDLIAEAVGTVKSNVYKYLGEMEQRGMISELHSRVKRSLPLNSDALTTRLREPLKDMTSTRTLFERNCISGLPLATCRLAMRHTSSTS